MCYFYCGAAGRKWGLFFHESICKIKMNTGGKLIWTVGCQMPITRSVGSGKARPRHWFLLSSIQCPFICGHGAAEPLILHNRTNGSDELFKSSYGTVIFDAIHLGDLLYFLKIKASHAYLPSQITIGPNSEMLVRRSRKCRRSCTCHLPRCHTQYKYVRCHQKNCRGGCFSIIVFIWRAFCCPEANA